MNNYPMYHKINSIFMRDPGTKFKTFTDEFSQPEFELLADVKWEATEKIDGTNIRVTWDGDNVAFGGRTPAAQLPTKLFAHLQATFTPDKFGYFLGPLILYGEGHGAGIQAVGGSYSEDQRFVLFDVLVYSTMGRLWLQREDVESIADKMCIPVVPRLPDMTLWEAVQMCRAGFRSTFGACDAEGIVLRAPLGLLARSGSRIITKVKTADYAGR